MKLIVGLGNPDGKYNNTWHNVGFSALDFFANKNKIKIAKSKCRSLIFVGDDYMLAKPQTYMNLSGDAVLELKKYFKIPLENILIILDDIDLPRGKIRYRQTGSAGTHNGLRDIVNKVGETPRIRIGVGRDEKMDLKDFVLSYIDPESKEILNSSYAKVSDLIKQFIDGELCQDTTI